MVFHRTLFWIILGAVLFLGFFLRLYRIDAPLADWHSWRQVDTASVTREFVDSGYDLLHPRFHDLSNVPSGMDNPQGYRFVEFPLFNLIHGVLFETVNVFTLEVWGRLVTITASVASAFFIFGIMNRYFGKTQAVIAAFFYSVLPFSLYFGRVILPDPLMTMSFLGAVYFFSKWTDKRLKLQVESSKLQSKIQSILFFSLSVLFAISALLLKPFAGFFLLPLALISYQTFGMAFFRKWQLYLYAALALTPLLLWRWWMLAYPEGIPVNEWLFNGGGIRFTGAYFFWIFADRIGRLILGYWGIGLFILGFITLLQTKWVASLREGRSWIVLSFLLSSLIYLVIVARGNVQHDYYQIPIIPSLVMVLGIGGAYLLHPPKLYHPWITRLIFVGLTAFMVFFSWYHVRDFFNINNPNVVVAGKAVSEHTPEDAKIVTFYGGDTTLLYQTKRSGWASLQDPLPVLIEKGAEYVAIVNPTTEDLEGIGQEYEIVASGEAYLILDLQKLRE